MNKKEMQTKIARRASKELEKSVYVNVGIGIPTIAANYLESDEVYLHTENGLLGVGPYDEDNMDPNLVNAGKMSVTELSGGAYFSSSESFAMIRGGHIDTVVLGVLQADQTGEIANWSIPGKNIIGVGGAMDLLEGAQKVIVTMTHTTKHGDPKILKELTFPKTSLRKVDLIITELAVFKVEEDGLHLVEIMEGATLEEIEEKTEADFINDIE